MIWTNNFFDIIESLIKQDWHKKNIYMIICVIDKSEKMHCICNPTMNRMKHVYHYYIHHIIITVVKNKYLPNCCKDVCYFNVFNQILLPLFKKKIHCVFHYCASSMKLSYQLNIYYYNIMWWKIKRVLKSVSKSINNDHCLL